MKIPYFLQGALFAPVCAVLIFVLKTTCPAAPGCFADAFISPVFLPLPFLYKLFGTSSLLYLHEPIFLLGYWMIVGLFAGLAFDIYKKKIN